MIANYEESLRRACVKFDGEAVLRWIRETYTPADVFSAAAVREFVRDNYAPDEVFPANTHLAEWARLNGYVKEGGAT